MSYENYDVDKTYSMMLPTGSITKNKINKQWLKNHGKTCSVIYAKLMFETCRKHHTKVGVTFDRSKQRWVTYVFENELLNKLN